MLSRLVTLLAAVSTILSTQAPAQNPSPLFSATSTELVVLPVTVTEGDGRFVSGLPKARFAVYDDGRRQEIALFSNEDTPVTVGLVIDDSSSMGPKLGQVVAAALAFARSSNPQDEVFALDFNDRVQDVIGGRSLPAGDIHGLNAVLTSLIPQGRTALYDAILVALDRETDGTGRRKVLVVISDGGDNASTVTLEQVLSRARQTNVTIYTIGLFDRDNRDSNPGVLKKLAAETGGERFLPSSPGPLLAAVDHIAREIRNVYTLGFAPPDHDGRYHRVRVAVDVPNGKHLSIRSRPGYFAAAASTQPAT